MADGLLSAHVRPVRPGSRRTPARVWYRLTPWWVKVVVVWIASRLISLALLELFASWQKQNAWTGAHPSYLAFAQLWDSTWYRIIAESGYPSTLPLTADGHVGENAWAFLPGYPMLVRAIMLVTGLHWDVVSVAVSVVFSLATALLLYRLFRMRLPASTALFSVVLFCVAPLSPIMQVSYAESMSTFLLVLALFLLLNRRYALIYPVVALLALTRPSGLAFALAMAGHVVYRFVTRGRDEFPAADRWLASGLAAFSLLMGFAWSIIAWAVTGIPSAYTDTELAWRSSYVGYRELTPFTPWIQGAEFWAGQWHLGGFAIVLLVAVVLAFAVFLFTPASRRLGPDLRIWSASYALYLLAVFFPQSSTFRLLVPLFPVLGAVAQPKSTLYRGALVVLFIAGQFGWLYLCWWSNGYDWTPP